MNPSSTYSRSAPNISGAIRYERIAILEAALKIKEKRQRQWWRVALTTTALVATVAVGVLLVVA